MKLWATNEARAKSKFWYFLRKLKKVKKSNGQVLAINELCKPMLLDGVLLLRLSWSSLYFLNHMIVIFSVHRHLTIGFWMLGFEGD
ncbi:PREDICTED: 60S ribosomal protein L18a-like [Prunus mume]|uniref:60S ribosomal protein L18a-like n=1 Tax=Prunus mume TaxID=102107 RepID=A0ABM0PUG2_PRUMU|nr:PREDICTED: 60S ribosomal protein L18a-like [Prunus mume]